MYLTMYVGGAALFITTTVITFRALIKRRQTHAGESHRGVGVSSHGSEMFATSSQPSSTIVDRPNYSRLQLALAYGLVVAQPVKIIVGFAQVVVQIGNVLRLEMPKNITMVINVLKPLVANVLESFVPVGCFTTLDYYQRWNLQIVAVPMILALSVCGIYCVQRLAAARNAVDEPDMLCRNADAVQRLRSDLGLVVFIIYPTVCSAAFSTLNCRYLNGDIFVLIDDYSVDCMAPRHKHYTFMAYIVIVLWAFGIPFGFGAMMLVRSWRLPACSRSITVAVSYDLGVAEYEAVDAVHAIELGSAYGFLLDAFRPRCFLWEPIGLNPSFKHKAIELCTS
eukprot:SAG11_NODE_2882_length_2871_cov_3.451659_2_plen_337_part_00